MLALVLLKYPQLIDQLKQNHKVTNDLKDMSKADLVFVNYKHVKWSMILNTTIVNHIKGLVSTSQKNVLANALGYVTSKMWTPAMPIELLLDQFYTTEKDHFNAGHRLWILKPAGSSQGNGRYCLN